MWCVKMFDIVFKDNFHKSLQHKSIINEVLKRDDVNLCKFIRLSSPFRVKIAIVAKLICTGWLLLLTVHFSLCASNISFKLFSGDITNILIMFGCIGAKGACLDSGW